MKVKKQFIEEHLYWVNWHTEIARANECDYLELFLGLEMNDSERTNLKALTSE